MSYVTRFTLLLSILFAGIVPFQAQEEFYGPYHDYVRDARWNSDGTQFLTRGLDAYINVWRDSDGLLLFRLDHSEWMPPSYDSASYVSAAAWNEDETAIITEVYTHNQDLHIREQAWSAETGELIYSYVKASGSGHAPYQALSQKLNSNRVATWQDDTLAILDIDLNSALVGETVLDITFDGQLIDTAQWNDDLTLVLMRTHPSSADTCYNCSTGYYLIDMTLTSDLLGEIQWQTDITGNASDYIWDEHSNYLVIHTSGEEDENLQADHTIQLWNLDQSSAELGSKVVELSQTMGRMGAILLLEDRQQLITVDINNLAYVEGAHPMAGPQCIDEHCVFNIQVWDINTDSPTFAAVVNQIEHIATDVNSPRIHFNQSRTQLHIETRDYVDAEMGLERVDTLTAYDLETWKVVDATDVIPREEPELSSTIERPQVDLSILDNADDYYPIAVNPDNTKVLVGSFTRDLIFIFDLETGEWLLPQMIG